MSTPCEASKANYVANDTPSTVFSHTYEILALDPVPGQVRYKSSQM